VSGDASNWRRQSPRREAQGIDSKCESAREADMLRLANRRQSKEAEAGTRVSAPPVQRALQVRDRRPTGRPALRIGRHTRRPSAAPPVTAGTSSRAHFTGGPL